MVIRLSEKNDLNSVLKIEQKSFPNPWNMEMFESELNSLDTYFTVVEIDGVIGGYCILRKCMENAELLKIAIIEQYRKKSVGLSLLNDAIECASLEEIEKIYLEVNSSNLNALSLYKKVGFKQYSIRKDYYSNGDALMMEKLLG